MAVKFGPFRGDVFGPSPPVPVCRFAWLAVGTARALSLGMKTTKHTAIAAILTDGREISLSELDRHPHAYVSQLRWSDGTLGWAKSWAVWTGKDSNDKDGTWIHSSVGAGAYGNMIVWRSTDPRTSRVALLRKYRASLDI